MKDFKVRVSTAEERQEAIALFKKLGGMRSNSSTDDRIGLVAMEVGEIYVDNSCHWYVYDGKEITIHQLRYLVAKSKPTEQGLISGKDALIALANGEEVEVKFNNTDGWNSINKKDAYSFEIFLDPIRTEFRLKPSTITLNVEIPAPFEPKDGDRVWFICDDNDFGYAKSESYGDDIKSFYGWWRTEEQIKQVVAALRGAIKNG